MVKPETIELLNDKFNEIFNEMDREERVKAKKVLEKLRAEQDNWTLMLSKVGGSYEGSVSFATDLHSLMGEAISLIESLQDCITQLGGDFTEEEAEEVLALKVRKHPLFLEQVNEVHNQRRERRAQQALLNSRGAAISTMEEEIDILIKGVSAVSELVNDSNGIDGLHLNGDLATWDDLLEGGCYETWLIDFSKALQHLEAKHG